MSCSVNSLLAITTHFDGTHFFSGSSILFLVFFSCFFGQHNSLHYSTKKTWCFNAKILLRTSSRGRMCWKGNSGPVGCFFVIAYSMYAVEVSFVLPKRQQYQVNNQIFSTTNRGSEPVNPKNISENIPSHEGGQMGCYCYILTFTPLSHNGWEELSNTTTSTLNKAFCFNFK